MPNSGFYIIMVIMKICVVSLQEALQAVRSARVMANPNEGFLRQMAEFQQSGLEKVLLTLISSIFLFIRQHDNYAFIDLGLAPSSNSDSRAGDPVPPFMSAISDVQRFASE